MFKNFAVTLSVLLVVSACKPPIIDDVEDVPVNNETIQTAETGVINLGEYGSETYISTIQGQGNPFGQSTINKRRDNIAGYEYGYRPNVDSYYIEEGSIDSSVDLNITALEANATGIIDRVFFGYNSYNLTGPAKRVLDRQITWLKGNSGVNVVIEGHCDERGTREYNIALGERRANTVRNYMILSGIDKSRIRIVSYGKEHPDVLGSHSSAWSKNRRSVTVLQ